MKSLQKYGSTSTGVKAENAPFKINWLHQFFHKPQSLLHKQNPKSAGKVFFRVLLFFQQQN